MALCDDLERWEGEGREAQDGGNIYIIMTDSHSYMAETNITL